MNGLKLRRLIIIAANNTNCSPRSEHLQARPFHLDTCPIKDITRRNLKFMNCRFKISKDSRDHVTQKHVVSHSTLSVF